MATNRTSVARSTTSATRDARAAGRLRALVDAEIAGFRRHLRRATKGRDRGVHEARKALQRLRATVMLFAAVRPRLAEQENVRLRTLRRRLGPLRDGAARAETLRLLARRKAWLPWRATLLELAALQLRQHAQAWSRRGPDAAYWVRIATTADNLNRRAARWPYALLDAECAERACARSERRLRKALREAVGRRGREPRHDLRRKLRRYANLRRIVATVYGREDSAVRPLLSLAKRCGHEGDLWMAAQCARRAAVQMPEFRGLARELDAQRRRMCEKHDASLRRLAIGKRGAVRR